MPRGRSEWWRRRRPLRDPARGPESRSLRRATFALFAVAAGTNIPAPLLIVYRDRLALGPDVLAAVFGCYALGLVPALALAGPLSDRIGRRRVVLPCMVLAGLTSLLLVAAASSLAVLFVGRALQGAVSGAVFTVASAWIGELSLAADRARRSPGAANAAGRRAAVAMTAGFSVGPSVAGVLGQYAPLPTTLPYLLHVVLVAAGVLAARSLPETVEVLGRDEQRPRGPVVEPADRAVVVTVLAPLAVCVYAFPTVSVAAVPLLVRTDAPPVLLTGVLAGLTLGAGALAAPLQRRLGARTALGAVLLGTVGYLLAALGAGTASPLVLLAAALTLGAGGGLALAAGLAMTARLARPARRGALSAVFLGCAYVGFGAPYVVAVAAAASSVQVPLLVAAGLAALLAVRLLVATRAGQTSG